MATILEILSNEVIMQIFEYLDAYHIFKAFLNLNFRFNQLLQDHRLCLKFHSKHIYNNDVIDIETCYTMINYLTAVTLINDKHIRMFMSACKESDLIHLQSLNLHQVRLIRNKSSAVKFISQLKSLRNLRIQSIGEIQTLIIMIFCLNGLPELKSFECINSEYQTNVIFPGCQPTNIESLTVDCVLYNLSNLLLQTPKLKYLNIILTNYGPNEWTLMSSPLPMMMNLVDLRMEIPFISYIHLSDLMKSMPNLKILELSGTSMGENIDNGQQLKQLFGHLHELELDNLECLTSAKSVNKILSTFNDEFWLDVTCSIKYNRAYLSGFGHAKVGEY